MIKNIQNAIDHDVYHSTDNAIFRGFRQNKYNLLKNNNDNMNNKQSCKPKHIHNTKRIMKRIVVY
jgi:hypothetical protein